MAWVSVHDNVIGKRLRELTKELDMTQEEALGTMVSLWLWGLNNADKEGKIVGADKDDILEAFSIKVAANHGGTNIVDALIKTRWIDEPEPGVLYIHDWEQWQEQWYKAMERREKDAKRKAESRRSGRGDTDSGKGRAEDDPGDLPFQESTDIPPAQPPVELKYSKEFEMFWDAYPRKVDKGMAYKKYQARRRDGFSAEELLEAAKNYAAQCRKKKTEKDYIKHPKTFLGDTTPFTQFLARGIEPGGEKPRDEGENPFAEFGEEE